MIACKSGQIAIHLRFPRHGSYIASCADLPRSGTPPGDECEPFRPCGSAAPQPVETAFRPPDRWRPHTVIGIPSAGYHAAQDSGKNPKDCRAPGILSAQCLERRISDKQTLIDEIPAWEQDLK